LFSNESQKLKCDQENKISRNEIKSILSLKDKLAKHYSQIYFKKGEQEQTISPTDTLLSKIILGTLACVPAYDRYFIIGLKEMKINNIHFNESSLNELFDYIENNEIEIKEAQKLIFTKTKYHYPIMKILDMYFWQIGYEKSILSNKI
jgi:hypothetical protein